MKAALVGNTAWLDDELVGFEQLTVGLLAESIQVVHVVPEAAVPQLPDNGFVSVLPWQETRPTWLNRHRLTRTAEALAAAKVDVLHAMDGRLWGGVIRLGQLLSLPVVLQVGSALDVPLVKKLHRQWRVLPGVCFAPGSHEAEVATRQAVEAMQTEVAWVQPIVHGVHVDPDRTARHRRPLGEPVCLVVSGDGRLDAHYEALLHAIAQTTSKHGQAQFFFDGMHDDQQALYRLARRLGLLSHVSFSPRQLGHREVMLGADVLIHPQPLGRTRGLLLQAMAQGMAVVAQEDAWADALVDSATSWLIDRPEATGWAMLLNRVIGEPQAAQGLGQSALEWVRANRKMCDTVEQVQAVYEKAVGKTIPIRPH